MSEQPGLWRSIAALLRPFWPLAALAAALGAASGVATALLLATINTALQGERIAFADIALAFAGLCAVAVAGKIGADIANTAVGERIVAAMRRDLAGKIAAAPIDALERYRLDRLVVALSQDIQILSGFVANFSGYAIALAVALGCFVYLFLLSPLMFGVTLGGFVLGGAIQAWARRAGIRRYEAGRATHDEMQKQFHALTEGAKELRLSRPRRARVLGGALFGAIDRLVGLRIRAATIYQLAGTAGTLIFFAVVAALLWMKDGAGLDRAALSGFVLVLLYVKGPVDQLIGALPALGQAQVSFVKLAEMSRDFATREPHLGALDAPAAPPEFESLGLRAARYAYPAPAGGAAFGLGPIDLSIRRGEIVFVVGENGSGKTTLIKLLLGLYAPSEGALLLNGAPVAPEARDAYRQLFSAVFFDYHLFDEVISPAPADAAEIATYLEKLEIAHKVRLEDGRFSTVDLSAGQRKRLALIQVYLERRPIAVFDEWAAEQDPTFRRIFYAELLPDLRRRGKTLIVVSHDDRYFDAADRVIRLEGGRIAEERRMRGAAL